MIHIEKIQIEGIPALKMELEHLKNEPLPVVLFWHGWTSLKERNLYYGYLLANEGIRVILPDAMGHGERSHELSEEERQIGIFPVIINSIKETEKIWTYIREQGWLLEERFGLAGTSMGAMITLGSLATYEGIKVAVSLMGTPYLLGYARHIVEEYRRLGVKIPYSEEQINEMTSALAPFDLSRAPEKVVGVPLLFWHGMRDPLVPYTQSRLFYDSFHSEPGFDMRYIIDLEAQHVVSQEGALGLHDWMTKYL